MATEDDDENEALQIGARIAARMKQIGMAPETLASMLGVVDDTIYKMMAGKTVARWVSLANVARALRTTPNAFLGFEGPNTRARLERILMAAFEGLRENPDQARNYAQSVLEALDRQPNPNAPSEEYDTVRTEVAYEKRRSGGQ